MTTPKVTRREALAALGSLAVVGCRSSGEGSGSGEGASVEGENATPLDGQIAGDHADRGHRLRSTMQPTPSSTRRASVVIVGAGISGLSAAWRLHEAGVSNVELLELAPEAGGTARAGRSASGAFPWGAHYLPVPNPESAVTNRFVERIGLAHREGPTGALEFDDRHLVFEPEDRLFFRGTWYEGLYLRAGASRAELDELARFEAVTHALRERRGRDGRLAFAIPTALSSRDPEFVALDHLTMASWLDREGFRSERLRNMIEYACRDDYGAGIAVVSAWSAIHYFSGRRSVVTPETRGSRYFTWPSGNAWLVDKLHGLAGGAAHCRLSADRVVVGVSSDGRVTVVDAVSGAASEVVADAVILAVPNHVSGHLLGRKPFAKHAPWLVANVSLDRRPKRSTGAWNNVLYSGLGVGYVDSSHQRVEAVSAPVYSYYRPLPFASRGWLLASDFRRLADAALADLRPAHPDIAECVSRVDIWRWGHGTIVPEPGVMFDGRRDAFAAAAGVVELAHTDMSGLPFFEESQYQGVAAAERVLDRLGDRGERWGAG